jgi:hypothetical protein
MKRSIQMLVLATAVVALAAPVARADSVYHSAHVPFAVVGDAPLRSGFVENIHANGPVIFAHEQYVVNGAEPNTAYDVVLLVFPGDTGCASAPVEIGTATIMTNGAGNGTAFHVFAPSDADGLHGLTVGGMWELRSGGVTEYATACGTIVLD